MKFNALYKFVGELCLCVSVPDVANVKLFGLLSKSKLPELANFKNPFVP